MIQDCVEERPQISYHCNRQRNRQTTRRSIGLPLAHSFLTSAPRDIFKHCAQRCDSLQATVSIVGKHRPDAEQRDDNCARTTASVSRGAGLQNACPSSDGQWLLTTR
jgi:hypothetical protein